MRIAPGALRYAQEMFYNLGYRVDSVDAMRDKQRKEGQCQKKKELNAKT